MNITFGISFGNACTTAICAIANNILYLINGVLVPVLFAVAFIVFLYGIAKAYIFSGGDPEKVSQGHKLLLWGIIAFVVMVSIWGLVNVVANTFGLAGAYAPPTPSSISPYGSAIPAGGTGGTTYVQKPQCNSAGKCFDAYGNPTN
ncbi:MAG TPA: pilin [Candidatus Paceibacterota bacterium]|nr:pilin [Candidatus Paceibacterota bacterium]